MEEAIARRAKRTRAERMQAKSDLELVVRRNQIHLAFFAYSAARRDVVVESWQMTAWHFKRRFNIGDEYPEETLIRAISDEMALLIHQKGL